MRTANGLQNLCGQPFVARQFSIPFSVGQHYAIQKCVDFVAVIVRDKLPFNCVEMQKSFRILRKRTPFSFDVLYQRNKVVLSIALNHCGMDCLACVFVFDFLARTANKA